ncbi:MAG: hypothetical protein AB7F86_18500 [Bdellovibrionales bacterium]
MADGAAVYEKADFDSRVLEYLSFQTKVTISKKAYPGVAGLGLFHKVKLSKGFGYIPDTDVRVVEKEATPPPPAAGPNKGGDAKSQAFNKPEEDMPTTRPPLYLARYLGLAYAQVNFTEKFSGKKLSDKIGMYGLRMMGPGTLFDGPPLDVNLWVSFDKPNYYSRFASGGPNGFLLFGDVMAMMPLVNLDNWVVSYGLGVMWTFTRYRLQVRQAGTNVDENTDSLEFRIGADAGLGVGARLFKRYMLRADVKYYYEKTAYLGYLASLQMEY